MTPKRSNSVLTAGLALTTLVVASISLLVSVGTVTAQQNNTTTTATPTPTPEPIGTLGTGHPAPEPTETPTATPTPGITGPAGFALLTMLIAGLAVLLTVRRVAK